MKLFGVTFRHGVHPPDSKGLTDAVPIRRMPFPDRIALPLRQHAGKPARCLVEKGDRVERGDKIAEADGFVSVPIHASAAGTVAAVEWWPHPDGSMAETVVIDVERYSPQIPRPRIVPRWEGLSPEAVRAAVQEAGVVGLGGAAFPTHVKLSPPEDLPIEWLLVNGAECEPYLTTDHRTMVEYPERVHFGIRIMMQCLGVERAVIGVEKNKPDAIAELERTLPGDLDVSVMPLTVKYPQGAEKMLIEVVTGREVPSGKLPMHVGAVVQNVGSIATIAEVFETGLPLIERVVTVTGPGVGKPSNLIVPVGTQLQDVLDFCGGVTDDAAEIVFGGPMMGTSQPDMRTPLIKGTTGVVVLTEAEVKPKQTYPCIKCGHCLDACPVFLNPSELGILAQAGRYDEMEERHLMDCMLCGCCSYVCPSNIPLSQMFALSKNALRKRQAA
ncbi:MAG: electron transport complex subunit RsxC [Gemmatimonadetes bacterium]|nr:electron transport complex subunit RsxC [Gemmatimonadota bacterium]NNL31486.1 electron transport complex subunit RsxC [Gemmatimonadota bacterium]